MNKGVEAAAKINRKIEERADHYARQIAQLAGRPLRGEDLQLAKNIMLEGAAQATEVFYETIKEENDALLSG